MFPLDPISNSCGDHSAYISTSTSTSQQPRQTQQQLGSKEAWCLQQDAVSPTFARGFVLHDTPHPSAIPDFSPKQDPPSRPAGTHRPLSTSLSTPPTTPRKKKGVKGVKTTPRPVLHRGSSDHRDLQRRPSFSPSLTPSSSQMPRNKMSYPDTWSQRLQNYNIHSMDNHLPLSPPPSDIIAQHENIPADNAAHMNRPGDIFSQSPAISMPSPSSEALARQQQRYLAQFSNSALPNQRPPSPDAIFSSSSSDHHSLTSWNSGSLGSSAYSFPSDMHSHDARAWWSPASSRIPERQPAYQSVVASSAPASPFQNANTHNDMMHGGLMIQFEPSLGLPTTTDPSLPASNVHSTPTTHETLPFSNPETSAPQRFVDSSSFTTPLVHDPNPTKSPSLSPTAPGSSLKDAQTAKRGHRRNHSAKLSSQAMSSPKPATRSGRSSTSPKGHNKSASVSFVNFTANDSKKILTGVAPSGSSKTKARREQEARDRRRKLSEAALNAVRSAGGDVEALEAVLC